MYRTFKFWIFPDDAVLPDIPSITPPDFVALFQNIRQIVFVQFRYSFLCFLAIVKHRRSPFILWPSSSLDFHTLPATTVRRSAAPIPSGQTGLDASRQAQFSAGIVILCGVRREPPTSAGSYPATGGRWRCRTPRLSPRTVFKTGSEATRIHLPNILVRGIGHHHAMSLCRISLFVRFSASRQTPHLNAHSMRI